MTTECIRRRRPLKFSAIATDTETMDNQNIATLQVLKLAADSAWESALWLSPADPAFELAWREWASANAAVVEFLINTLTHHVHEVTP